MIIIINPNPITEEEEVEENKREAKKWTNAFLRRLRKELKINLTSEPE